MLRKCGQWYMGKFRRRKGEGKMLQLNCNNKTIEAKNVQTK